MTWADFSAPWVRCSRCGTRSPDLPDHQAVLDWDEDHQARDCPNKKASTAA